MNEVWKPTEGLRRSEAVMREIERSAVECDLNMQSLVAYPALRWRMAQIIAEALDHALNDGASSRALDEKGKSDAAPDAENGASKGHWEGDIWREPLGNITKVRLSPDEADGARVLAEASGVPVSRVYADMAKAKAGIEPISNLPMAAEPIDDAPKKRRGRPPGKKAKAKKADKAITTETTL